MNEGDIKPVSDEEFKRSQLLADRRARRELEKKMRARPLEQLIEDFTGKVEPDETAPLGSCERCGEAYQQSESGRLADHVCADRRAAITQAPTHTTAAERAAERSVDRVAMGIRRVRRDIGEEE